MANARILASRWHGIVGCLLTVGLGPVAACGAASEGASAGKAALTLAAVPSDVACLRITAAASERSVVSELDVMPDAAFSETLTGLPFGTVTFSAEAFSSTCDVVTAATVPNWVSDSEAAALAQSRIANVALTMHRNGRAKVAVDFADEPACSASGSACTSVIECCSHACSKGICQAPPDAGPDAH